MDSYKYWLLQNYLELPRDIVLYILSFFHKQILYPLTKKELGLLSCEPEELLCKKTFYSRSSTKGCLYELEPIMINDFSENKHNYTLLSTRIKIRNKKVDKIIYEYSGHNNSDHVYLIKLPLRYNNISSECIIQLENDKNHSCVYDNNECIIYNNTALIIMR